MNNKHTNKNMPKGGNGKDSRLKSQNENNSPTAAPKKKATATKIPTRFGNKNEVPDFSRQKTLELENSSTTENVSYKTSKSSLQKGSERGDLPASPMPPATGAAGKVQNSEKIPTKPTAPTGARRPLLRELSRISAISAESRPPSKARPGSAIRSYTRSNTDIGKKRAETLPRTAESSPRGGLKTNNTNKPPTDANSVRRRVLEANKVKVFEGALKKLMELQSDFMKKCENMKDVSSEKIIGTYKFVGMVVNDNCKLVVHDDDLLRLPKKLPAESVSDLKESVRSAVGCGLNILYEHLSDIKTAHNDIECRMNIELTREQLEKLQEIKISELLQQVDYMCKSAEAGGDSEKSRTLLQNARRDYHLLERKISELRKQHSEKLIELDHTNKDRLKTEITEHEHRIAQLTKEVENYKQCTENQDAFIAAINSQTEKETSAKAELVAENRQLKETVDNLTRTLDEKRFEYENDKLSAVSKNDKISSLEIKLKQARERISELEQKDCVCENDTPPYNLMVIEMQKRITCLETAKAALERQIPDLLNDSQLLKNYEETIAELNAKLDDGSKISDEKSKELDALKQELEKSRSVIARLEQQVENNRQKLQVRSSMQVNTELITKSEEFRNLFNTLGTKQAEITRQAHIIKLLEDNVDRTHLLRVKQEEKVSVMEEEISELKKTMSLHRRIIAINRCRNLFEPVVGDVAKDEDENDTSRRSRREARQKAKTNCMPRQSTSDACLETEPRKRKSTITVRQILT